LLGSGAPSLILRGLHRRILVDDVTLGEVSIDPATGKSAKDACDKLIADGLIEKVEMTDQAYELFISLTGANPPDDLDDGEAATIAQALQLGAAAVIDERKATRIAASSFPDLVVFSSIDLFGCSDLVRAIAEHELASLLYGAFKNARMRVPLLFLPWIVATVGESRLVECSSVRLPRAQASKAFSLDK
jgi:hypothetical protein